MKRITGAEEIKTPTYAFRFMTHQKTLPNLLNPWVSIKHKMSKSLTNLKFVTAMIALDWFQHLQMIFKWHRLFKTNDLLREHTVSAFRIFYSLNKQKRKYCGMISLFLFSAWVNFSMFGIAHRYSHPTTLHINFYCSMPGFSETAGTFYCCRQNFPKQMLRDLFNM